MVASLLLCIVSAICATLAIVSYRHWHVAAARPLLLLMLALTIWTSGFALEIALQDLSLKLLAAKIQYIGIVAIPIAWLIFAKRYGTLGEPIAHRIGLLLWIEPVLTLLFLWTNEQHHLFYRTISIKQTALLGPMLSTTYGPIFWVHALYAYILILAGSILLLRALLRNSIRGRQQLIGPLLATIIPWAANAIYLSGWVELDITPFAFAATGVIWAWSVFRIRMLDLIPIARDEVLESMSDGVIVQNDQNQVIDINNAALSIIKRSRKEVMNKQLITVLPESAEIMRRFRPIIHGSEELQIMDTDGVERWFEVRISPLQDRLKQYSGHLIVLSDITERKNAEAILLAAKEAAEHASRTKSAILMNMSHELLTPLNAIIGYSELLLLSTPHTSPEHITDLTHIMNSGQNLLNMVRDVLDLAQVEAGVLRCDIQPINLDQLVESLAANVMPTLQMHHNQLAINTSGKLGTIYSDQEKLERIIAHLLDNAAKFTEYGTVTLSVYQTLLNQQPIVTFHIADTGHGIASEAIEGLFQPFTQEDMSTTRRHGGMGIGLAIVHQFCQLLGGTLNASSKSGAGSTFELTIPDLKSAYTLAGQESTPTSIQFAEEQINGIDLTR